MKVNLLFISSFFIISKFFLTKLITSSTLGNNLLFLDNSLIIVSKFINLVYLPNSSLLTKVLYKLVNETGPSHNKKFTVEVIIDGIVYGTGTSHSKKSAEQIAAKDALNKAQKGMITWEEHMK